MALSPTNQKYLDDMKKRIESSIAGRTIQHNAIKTIDSRLASGQLTADQATLLKNQLLSVTPGAPKPKATVAPTEFQNVTTGPYTLENAQKHGYVQPTAIVGSSYDKTKLSGDVSTQGASGNGSWSTTTPTDTGAVGDISSANANAQQFQSSGKAFEDRANKTAKDIEANANAMAKKEQDLIKERDDRKRSRSDSQESELDAIEAETRGNMDLRRKDADALYKAQNEIASRNANIAAAQAHQSGLQLAQSEVESIRNDILGKYGQNILNAQDFKMKTNMNIDEALAKLNLDVFQKQQDIDNFRNLLDNEEYTPLLNAVKEASTGNKKAIDDISNFYQEFTKKKAEEEYGRMAKTERYLSEEKEFQGASAALKERMLYEKVNEIPGFQYVVQDIGGILNQYPGRSMTFILSTIVEKAMKNQDTRNLILSAVQTGKLNLPKELSDKIVNDNNKEAGAAMTTVSQNINNEVTAEKNNPGTTYNNQVAPNSTNSYNLSQKNLDYIQTIRTNLAKKNTQQERDTLMAGVHTILGNGLRNKSINQDQYNAIINAILA